MFTQRQETELITKIGDAINRLMAIEIDRRGRVVYYNAMPRDKKVEIEVLLTFAKKLNAYGQIASDTLEYAKETDKEVKRLRGV